MNKWEYHVVDGSENSDHVERMCNELGTKGWELAGKVQSSCSMTEAALGRLR